MATKHPRIHLVLENPLFKTVESLAHKNDLSLSSQVRELIIEAIETYEDRVLTRIAEERTKSFNHDKALSHDIFWKKALKNGK